MSKAINIKVSGYYGMMNYGDDLFSYITYHTVSNEFINNLCEIVGPSYIDTNLNYLNFDIFNKYYMRFDYKGRLVRFLSYFYSTFKTDYYIFSGGSLFSNSGFNVKDTVFKLRFNRYNLHAMGVSVGPYKNIRTEKENIEKLKNFEYIAVRDKKSYERVDSYGLDSKIVLAGDLAGLGLDLIKPKNIIKRKNSKFILGFSPCCLGAIDQSRAYNKNFYNIVSELKKDIDLSIKIICLNENPYNGDLSLCEEVKASLEKFNIDCEIVRYTSLGVEGTWNFISNLDFYISVRLHGAITAYLNDVPFFLYEYHEKCTEFLEHVGMPTNVTNEILSNPSVLLSKMMSGKKDNLMSIDAYCRLSKINFLENPLFVKPMSI